MQIFVWTPVFNSSGQTPRSGNAGPVAPMLSSLRSCGLVLKAAVPFHNASDNTGGLQSFHILAKTCYCLANFNLRDENLITT